MKILLLICLLSVSVSSLVLLYAVAAQLRIKWQWGAKDCGPDSHVRVWGLEIKGLFSVLVMRFGEGSREAFHSHAFNCLSWLISGRLTERLRSRSLLIAGDLVHVADDGVVTVSRSHLPSVWPIETTRETFHQVVGESAANWVLSLRGPWVDTWRDASKAGDVTLTHGRKVAQ